MGNRENSENRGNGENREIEITGAIAKVLSVNLLDFKVIIP